MTSQILLGQSRVIVKGYEAILFDVLAVMLITLPTVSHIVMNSSGVSMHYSNRSTLKIATADRGAQCCNPKRLATNTLSRDRKGAKGSESLSQEYNDTYFNALDERIQHERAVIYNRVPKCGSTAIKTLYEIQSKRNGSFHSYRSLTYNKEHLDKKSTLDLIKTFKQYKTPWVFERHLHFLNTEDYGLQVPLYINVIRNPVSRFVSDYYFKRFEHKKPMSRTQRYRTVDKCILQNFQECTTNQSFTVIPYFCGQEDMCLKPSNSALERAKYNVDRYYGVVGITEDLVPTISLLEKTMPQFFNNITQIAMAKLADLKSRFKTHKKPTPSKEALYIMNSRLGLENEFYYFVR